MSPWWLLVGFAVLLIGITKSGFGSGVGLMIVPITLVAMSHLRSDGPAITLGLMLPLLIVGDLIAVWQYRKLFNKAAVLRLMPGSIVGILVGGAILFAMHNEPPKKLTAFIKIEIGFESVLLVSLHWYRMWREGANLKFHPSLIRSSAVGVFAGASSTLAHAAGPIISLHFLPQRMDRRTFVGTCAIYFFIVNTSKLPIYVAAKVFHWNALVLAAELLPLVFIGAAIGFWIARKLNDALFSRIVYALTFILGLYLLRNGFSMLR